MKYFDIMDSLFIIYGKIFLNLTNTVKFAVEKYSDISYSFRQVRRYFIPLFNDSFTFAGNILFSLILRQEWREWYRVLAASSQAIRAYFITRTKRDPARERQKNPLRSHPQSARQKLAADSRQGSQHFIL